MTHSAPIQKSIDRNQSLYLDSWRGGAALSVFLSHGALLYLLPLIPRGSPLALFTETLVVAIGSSAVSVFFVLSGLVIRLSVKNNTHQARFATRQYAISRMNRIIPPFLAAILISVAVYAVAPCVFQTGTREFATTATGNLAQTGIHIRPQDFFATLFFYNSVIGETIAVNSPLWSLSYEVWFYAWAAAFGVFAPTWLPSVTRRGFFIALSVLGCFALRPHFAFMGAIWLSGFVVGDIWLNNLLPSGKWISFARKLVGILAIVFTLFVMAVTQQHPEWIRYGGMAVEACIGLFAALSFSQILARPRPVAPNILAAVTPFAYSLYVFHMPILLLGFGVVAAGREFGLVQAAHAIVAMILAFTFAAVFGRWLERWRPFPI
jgi:peptidoglycan/LPS O-acetylase OafA/YrhL